MTEQNFNNYLISVNYNNNEESFEKTLEKSIKNLLKSPTTSWILEKYDIEYKRQIVINECEKGGSNDNS